MRVTLTSILIALVLVGCATNSKCLSEACQISLEKPKWYGFERDLKKSEAESLFRLANVSVDLDDSSFISQFGKDDSGALRTAGELGIEMLLNGASGWALLSGNTTQGDDARKKSRLTGFGGNINVIYTPDNFESVPLETHISNYDNFIEMLIGDIISTNNLQLLGVSDSKLKNSTLPYYYKIGPFEVLGANKVKLGYWVDKKVSKSTGIPSIVGTEITGDGSIVSTVVNKWGDAEARRSAAFANSFLNVAKGSPYYIMYFGSSPEIRFPPGYLTSDGIYHVPYAYEDGVSLNIPVEILIQAMDIEGIEQ